MKLWWYWRNKEPVAKIPTATKKKPCHLYPTPQHSYCVATPAVNYFMHASPRVSISRLGKRVSPNKVFLQTWLSISFRSLLFLFLGAVRASISRRAWNVRKMRYDGMSAIILYYGGTCTWGHRLSFHRSTFPSPYFFLGGDLSVRMNDWVVRKYESHQCVLVFGSLFLEQIK